MIKILPTRICFNFIQKINKKYFTIPCQWHKKWVEYTGISSFHKLPGNTEELKISTVTFKNELQNFPLGHI